MTQRDDSGRHDEVQGRTEHDTIVVGVVADGGFPTKAAGKLDRLLPAILNRRIDASIQWDVRVSTRTMPLTEENVVSLTHDLAAVKSQEDWDMAVYVTDLPRFARGRVVIADVNVHQGLAIVSMPALGLGVSRRLSKVILHVIGKIYAADAGADAGRGRRLKGMAGPVELAGSTRSEIDTYIALRRAQGLLRLIVGLVFSNRPWRLVWDLKSAIAAAAAAGAFGIFYSSIAQLSDDMGKGRLAVVTVAVIVVTTMWLIAYNRLWETPAGPLSRRRFTIYNASSIATVTISLVCMYAVLVLVLLTGSAIVIPPEFLSNQLGHSVGFMAYVDLAWLSASMGMVAGALGASFDSTDAIRAALYSQREAARRQQASEQEESEDR